MESDLFFPITILIQHRPSKLEPSESALSLWGFFKVLKYFLRILIVFYLEIVEDWQVLKIEQRVPIQLLSLMPYIMLLHCQNQEIGVGSILLFQVQTLHALFFFGV